MTIRPVRRQPALAVCFAGAYGIAWGGIRAVLAARGCELTALSQPDVGMFAFMLLGRA
jgi:hypothetical protein